MHILRILIPVLALAVLAFLAIQFLYRRDAPAQDCASSAPRVVAFGDSLIAGYGATTPGGFVTLLSNSAGIPIANLGKNGDTTADAKARASAALASDSDIVLVLLGGNDALRQVPVAQTEQNLGEVVSALQEGGSRVILLGVIGGFPRDPYAPMFERLAKTHDVTYVPNVLSGIIGHADLMSDQVHPNEAGYQKIADRLLPVLEKECSK